MPGKDFAHRLDEVFLRDSELRRTTGAPFLV
jgi:hypothetical protein